MARAGPQPIAGTYEGIDQVFELLGRIAQMTGGTFRVDLHDVLANDEHVVALAHLNAQRPGKTLDGNEAHVFNMKDGRVTEFWALAEDRYARMTSSAKRELGGHAAPIFH